MRDLNRKGAEKEGGTEMDAFMELSPEEATLLTPPSVSPVAQSVSPTPNKVADNQVVKVSIKMWQHPKTNSLIPWHSCRMWTKKHILRWVLVLSIFSFVFYHFFLSFFLSFFPSFFVLPTYIKVQSIFSSNPCGSCCGLLAYDNSCRWLQR